MVKKGGGGWNLTGVSESKDTYVSFKNMVLYKKKDIYEKERIKSKRKRTLSIHVV